MTSIIFQQLYSHLRGLAHRVMVSREEKFHKAATEKIKLELTPEDYVIEFNDHEGKRRCTLGIVADDQQEVGCTALEIM